LSCKAEDAALLPQGKDDNMTRRKTNRKDETVFKWYDYIINEIKKGEQITCCN